MWIVVGVVVLFATILFCESRWPGSMLGSRERSASRSASPQGRGKSHSRGHGDFDREVVGESHYQPALRKLKASQSKPFFRAKLVPEDSNPYDNQAVRVDIDGQTVGYLPREDAREWRAQEGSSACDAYLIDAGDNTNIGVWLRI